MRRIIALAVIAILGATAVACEKNNQIIALEQIEESREGCPRGCELPPPGCEIKGITSDAGTKVYHLPGGRFYELAVIELELGDRWFCTEVEAANNGYLTRAP